MRLMRERGFTMAGLAEERRLGEDDVRRLLRDLLDAGLIEPVEHPGYVVVGSVEDRTPLAALELFTPTIAGNALAKARIGKRMAREEAEHLLAGVLQRADEANKDERWLHWVR